MAEDRFDIEANARERERLRALIDGLDDDALALPVNEFWTVAASSVTWPTGTSASWSWPRRSRSGEPWVAGDAEPDGDWLNDTTRLLIHEIEPRRAAQFALKIAEQCDALVAELPLARACPATP